MPALRVRIPQVDVDVHGNYSKKGNQKLLFGTMTYTRLKISYMSGFNLAKACTTAIRYSAVRRQFELGEKDFDENVVQIAAWKLYGCDFRRSTRYPSKLENSRIGF